jgi:hypothetical protein
MAWDLLTEMSPDYLLFQKTAFKILLLHNSIESMSIVLLREILDHWQCLQDINPKGIKAFKLYVEFNINVLQDQQAAQALILKQLLNSSDNFRFQERARIKTTVKTKIFTDNDDLPHVKLSGQLVRLFILVLLPSE